MSLQSFDEPVPLLTADYRAMRHHHKIVVLTEGYSNPFLAKTAINMLRYRQHDIVAVLDQHFAGKTSQEVFGTGGPLPVVAQLDEIPDADAMYVGIAPPGGKLPEEWRPLVVQALRKRMDIVSGLHDFLGDDREYSEEAGRSGCTIFDVRRNRHKSTAKGHRFRPGCVRIHTVGHDCSIGKMVAALELQRALTAKGENAKFLATGQTGIMIEGEGVPIDCVVSDFVNGAAEELCQQNEHHDFLLIEGQGSITHPAFSAVTLGLLHGSAPDGLIFCYEAGRKQVKGFPGIDIPPMEDQLKLFELAANLRHPTRWIGFAINSRNLTPKDAEHEIAKIEDRFGLPACDVYRTNADKLVQASLRLREALKTS